MPSDQWHQAALAAREQLGNVTLVTTDEVLTEFLTALSNRGSDSRHRAAQTVRAIMEDPSVRIIEQSRDTFLAGLTRYEHRLDKGYSLQDCIAMNFMESEDITEVLTSDHNFEHEGFTILMKLDQ